MPVTLERETTAALAPVTAEAPALTLEALCRAFRADCLVEPQRYVDEVNVPCGGE